MVRPAVGLAAAVVDVPSAARPAATAVSTGELLRAVHAAAIGFVVDSVHSFVIECNHVAPATSTCAGKLRVGPYTPGSMSAPSAPAGFSIPPGGTHAAAFGFSNPEWVTTPLARVRVERFLLLEMPTHDRARKHLAKKYHFDVDSELNRVAKAVQISGVNLWNPGQVAATLMAEAKRLEAKGAGPLWVNVSTGPNPVTVAAGLASMFAKIQVYHVTKNGKDLVLMPTLRNRPPTVRELVVLGVLAKGGALSSRLLKTTLRAKGFFGEPGKGTERIREQGQLNAATRRLLEWGALARTKNGERYTYRLGPAGPSLVAMFLGPLGDSAEVKRRSKS